MDQNLRTSFCQELLEITVANVGLDGNVKNSWDLLKKMVVERY